MPESPRVVLFRLARLRAAYGGDAAGEKARLLDLLAAATLPSARDVLRLHETLLFLRAYPDDEEVLARADAMLDGFSRRRDLRRHRARLANSGIAGTELRVRLFAFAASWAAARWGPFLEIDWARFEERGRLERLLPWLVLHAETPGLDEVALDVREWLRRLKGPQETDAAFLIRRFDALRADPLVRETTYEDLDLPVRIAPGATTPARTREVLRGEPPAVPVRTLARLATPLALAARRSVALRDAAPPEARAIADLARRAMVSRDRDLDAFTHASLRDVRIAEWDDGLRLAVIGMLPERRLLLEAVYGYLILKNGVAVGYGTGSGLFASVEIAFNVFDTFRGVETSRLYGRILATFRQIFRADTFYVPAYQLGDDNDEAIRSGAWWFYAKRGFRPKDPAALALARREMRARRADPAHRSSRATLRALAAHSVFLHLGPARDDVLGALPFGHVGLAVTEAVAAGHGARREEAAREAAREAKRLLGVRTLAGFSPGERLAWARWSPLVTTLPGIERWSREERASLARVVRAKGGRRESDFALLFDRHRKLRRAIRALAESTRPDAGGESRR